MHLPLDSVAAPLRAETLLANTSIAIFNSTIREKAHAKFSGSENEIGRFFGLQQLDALLTEGLVPPQQIDVIFNGWPQTLDEIQGRTGKSNPRLIAERLSRGATIRIRDLQSFDSAIDAFRSDVQATFFAACQINMYLTPPRQTGFSPHFDSHDVFIMQCQGRKRWRIYPDYTNMMPLPLSSTPFDASRYQPSTSFEEFVLESGETLYIPRGFMHAAACEERESLHLTVSLTPITLHDVLAEALARAARDDTALRSGIFPDSADTLLELAANTGRAVARHFNASVTQSIFTERLEALHTTPSWNSELASLMLPTSVPKKNVGESVVHAAQEGIADAAETSE